MPDSYCCTLKTKSQGKIKLKNQHYKGFASFEERSRTYVPFVAALHKKLERKNVTFVKGIGVLFYVVVGLLLLMGLAYLGLAIFLFTENWWISLFMLLALAFILFKSIPFLKKNKPGTYTVETIPKELLPLS